MGHFLLFSYFVFIFPFHGSIQEPTFEKAKELYEKGFYEASIREINLYLKRKSDLDALFFKHKIQLEVNDNFGAIKTLSELIKYKPGFHEAYFQRASLYMQMELYEQALKDLNYLIKNISSETQAVFFQIDPTGREQVEVSTLESMNARLYSMMGECYKELNQYEESIEFYNQAIHEKKSATNYLNRALAYEYFGRRVLAINDLDSALIIEPSNELALYNKVLLDPTTEIPESIRTSTQFIPLLTYEAIEKYQSGDNVASERLYKTILELDENNLLALKNYGRLLHELGRYEEARSHFNNLRQQSGNDDDIFYLIANTYFKEDSFNDAISYYEIYLSRNPVDADIWYNAAITYHNLKQTYDACRCLKNAKRYGYDVPTSSMLWRNCK